MIELGWIWRTAEWCNVTNRDVISCLSKVNTDHPVSHVHMPLLHEETNAEQ